MMNKIVLASALAVLLTMVSSCGAPREQEVLITPSATLTSDWREFRPTHPLGTPGPWNELLVELPQLKLPRMGLPDMIFDGEPVHVTAQVSGPGGVRLLLDKSAVVAFNNVVMLRLSNAELERTYHNYRFDVVGLRASRPLRLGKIVWLSCDPAARGDGACWPSAVK